MIEWTTVEGAGSETVSFYIFEIDYSFVDFLSLDFSISCYYLLRKFILAGCGSYSYANPYTTSENLISS